MHRASRLHYDFRLEYEGVLLSWAVPKGPSPNPADKRLAVQTEDHPLEYVDFEGVIPEGNYGAGGVIVWDTGTWIALEDPTEGLKNGKLLFNLQGFKLQGRWTLVRTKSDWLLIKERDRWVREESTDSYPGDSIYSGLTATEVTEGLTHLPEVTERARRAGARELTAALGHRAFMLAQSHDEAFSREGWIFEIKYDGYRLLGSRSAGAGRLLSRNGNDLTQTFPEIERALRGLPYPEVVLDGECVVHDEHGLPSFQRLQKRGQLRRRSDIHRASLELPATYYAFDLLAVGGLDVRGLGLTERKALLRRILPTVGPIRYSDHIATQGKAMFAQASHMRLEGIVAKRADSPYQSGRSEHWQKIRTVETDDFVVVGFTEPKNHNGGFGALHLAQYEDGELRYAGRAGTGFSNAQRSELRTHLDRSAEAAPPTRGPAPTGHTHHWVNPELVVEIVFKERTLDGLLRHPVFQRTRDDKPPQDCLWSEFPEALSDPGPVEDDAPDRVVHFSNLDKVFWPEDGFTKGDLIDYYRSVADWMLPLLRDRPVVLTRYPDGIHGKSFFQKNAPDFAPDWLRTETVWSEGSERDLSYFVCDDLESLLYVANSGSIPLHVWSSRVATLAQPDWCILDLDPKDAPFSDVVRCARSLHRICTRIGLPAFVKTSGSTGLHVLIPLGRQLTYEQSRTLAQLLAVVLVKELPDVATVTRNPGKREGRVYIDYVQNGHGRLLVAPFCVRSLPGAPVSAPLRWSEVNESLALSDHTIRTVPARLSRMRKDPWKDILDLEPNLPRALAELHAWMNED